MVFIITRERSTMLMGKSWKIHYFQMVMFNSSWELPGLNCLITFRTYGLNMFEPNSARFEKPRGLSATFFLHERSQVCDSLSSMAEDLWPWNVRSKQQLLDLQIPTSTSKRNLVWIVSWCFLYYAWLVFIHLMLLTRCREIPLMRITRIPARDWMVNV